MQLRYRTAYANQVHQLTIAVSKHLYLTQDGCVRWQAKAFDVNFGNCGRSRKTHLINYLIRDHFSGVFYGTLAHTAAVLPATRFLVEAWSPKPDYPFAGLPDALVIAQSYAPSFPDLLPFLARQSVQPLAATSGFQAGVRDVQTWEEYFAASIALAEGSHGQPLTFADARAECLRVCKYVCDSRGGKEPKILKYLAQRRECRWPVLTEPAPAEGALGGGGHPVRQREDGPDVTRPAEGKE